MTKQTDPQQGEHTVLALRILKFDEDFEIDRQDAGGKQGEQVRDREREDRPDEPDQEEDHEKK